MSDTFQGYLSAKRAVQANDEAALAKTTQEWSQKMMASVGIKVEISGAPICQEPCLFVGNHMSYLDIPTFFNFRSGIFVAKKEVKSWPLFGMATAAAGTIFVDRKSVTSHKNVAQEIASSVIEKKRSVIVFPEGTSSLRGKAWKKGVFAIAKENRIPLQAFRISYSPARAAAYIDDDTLATHLWNLLSLKNVVASIEFFPTQLINDVEADSKLLETKVHESLARHLDQGNTPKS